MLNHGAFMRQLVEEGIALAAATGNPVSYDFADQTMAFFDTFPPTQRASMAVDLERGRRLELSWLSWRAHAMCIEQNVSTPAHTAALRSLGLYAAAALTRYGSLPRSAGANPPSRDT